MRQALAAAAVSARLLRLRADEAGLRDAHHLTRRGDGHRPGDDPGPAGRLYQAWRDVAARPARLELAAMVRVAQTLGLAPAHELLERLKLVEGGNPIASAAEVAATSAQSLDGEIFGLMLADVALAQKLRWAVPVPLLATVILHPALKVGADGRRLRPSDPGWAIACHSAYAHAAAAAHARALDLARRADRLLAVAGKVRTKGGAAGVGALLADDAVAPTALKDLGSDRAARRFLERLASLGGIRELTGRPTFRLYGL